MSLPRVFTLLLVASLLIGLACGGGDDAENAEQALPTPTLASISNEATPGSASEAVATPTEEVPVLQSRELTEVPRSTSYADITFTVTDAIVSNASLLTYEDPEPEVGDGWHLFVHISALNELTGRPLSFQQNYLSLEVGGTMVANAGISGHPSQPSIQPKTALDYIAAFEVAEEVDFGEITLIIAEPGTEPALLPLTGPVPESGYPFEVEAAPGDHSFTSGPCEMTATPLSVQVDLDARIDGVGTVSAIDGTRRAATDERFMRFDMRVTLPAGSCVTGVVGDQLFRLQTDGVPRGPINNLNFLIDPGEASDFQLLYRVPVNAAELVLLAGDPAGLVSEIEVTAPSLNP